jgi:hypothetical protein
MTVYDGYDGLLHFFGHIARCSYKGKEIGARVICVMSVRRSTPYTDRPARIGEHP